MFKGRARVKVSGLCMWSGILKEDLAFESFTCSKNLLSPTLINRNSILLALILRELQKIQSRKGGQQIQTIKQDNVQLDAKVRFKGIRIYKDN